MWPQCSGLSLLSLAVRLGVTCYLWGQAAVSQCKCTQASRSTEDEDEEEDRGLCPTQESKPSRELELIFIFSPPEFWDSPWTKIT